MFGIAAGDLEVGGGNSKTPERSMKIQLRMETFVTL